MDEVEKDTPIRDSETKLCVLADIDETGLVVNMINPRNPLNRFEGYTDDSATSKKILGDVLVKGDMVSALSGAQLNQQIIPFCKYFNSGDLLKRDWFGFFYWSDRVGDTFRWKGENVATTEVSIRILSCAIVIGFV